MKKHILLLVFATLTGLLSYGQIKSEFNLPPKSKFIPKLYKDVDYSYKLYDESINESLEKNYLSRFNDTQLNNLKIKDYETYLYYINANKFFINLSAYVKSKFTVKELWYIYMYDDNLKKIILKK
jgi:hypothetical protein